MGDPLTKPPDHPQAELGLPSLARIHSGKLTSNFFFDYHNALKQLIFGISTQLQKKHEHFKNEILSWNR